MRLDVVLPWFVRHVTRGVLGLFERPSVRVLCGIRSSLIKFVNLPSLTLPHVGHDLCFGDGEPEDFPAFLVRFRGGLAFLRLRG